MNETIKIILEVLTPISVALFALIKVSAIYIKNRKNKTSANTLDLIAETVLEAEQLLGAGQGNAKLQWVQNKLNDKSKKTEKKINEVVSVLNTLLSKADKELSNV